MITGWNPFERWSLKALSQLSPYIRFDDGAYEPENVLLVWKISPTRVVFETMSYFCFVSIELKKIWMACTIDDDPIQQNLPPRNHDDNGDQAVMSSMAFEFVGDADIPNKYVLIILKIRYTYLII